MLSEKERFEKEHKLLSTLLNNRGEFEEFYQNDFNIDDVFSKLEYRKLYLDMVKFYETKNKHPDKFSLSSYVEDKNLRMILMKIPNEGTHSNIEKRLIEDSLERRIRTILQKKERLIGYEFAESLANDVDLALMEFSSTYFRKNNKSNKEKVLDVIVNINKARNGEFSNYIKTGFSILDKYTNGIPKGHLTVIAGRPGMGKTDFMLQLSRNLIEEGLKAGLISIEMEMSELLIRNMSCYAKIDSRYIEQGELTNEQYMKICEVSENYLQKDDYVIDDSGQQTPQSVKATLRRWMVKEKVDIVFVDYLTLIKTNYNQQRYDLEIGRLSNELREFAKDSGLPIVLLSQLNRSVESRTDKKPQLSDLRESGSIEQDAKVVLLLYRPGYYGIDGVSKGNYQTKDGSEILNDDLFQVIIAKCRGGQTGTISLKYIPKYHQFEDCMVKTENLSSNYQVSNNGELEDDYPF